MGEGNNRRGFFAGFLVGGILGSVLTLWLTGRVRRQLRERGIDVGGRLGELGAVIREKADEFLARAREVIREAVEEGKEARGKTRSKLEEKFGREDEE